jgi:hypothetical protein
MLLSSHFLLTEVGTDGTKSLTCVSMPVQMHKPTPFGTADFLGLLGGEGTGKVVRRHGHGDPIDQTTQED